MTRLHPHRTILLAASAMALAACHPASDDVAPTEARAAEAGTKAEGEHAPSQAKRITIDADGLSREQIQALVEHIEGLGDIASAKVQVQQNGQGETAILIEVAGADLPGDDYLRQEIQTFPGLSQAAIDVESVRPDEVAEEGMDIAANADKTPEEIKAEVEAKLAAQGIEGKVFVDVVDDGHGERRVEVRVESDEDTPSR